MTIDPYKILGVSSQASSAEIKSAYRELVKRHHPDAGGDARKILSLNAAWEILRDPEHRRAFDRTKTEKNFIAKEAKKRGVRNAQATDAAQATHGQVAEAESALVQWLKIVYVPTDRLLGQVINPFPTKLRDLSADPYDDQLMENFCSYLKQSQKKMKKVEQIYMSVPTPTSVKGFGLSLYHCLSQVQDALNELERYTMGYVDNYLHDGREMLREAKKRRLRLHEQRRRIAHS